MQTQNESSLAEMTPQRALQLLREGNERFVAGQKTERDFGQQRGDTREGQWPFAAILSCMDSRTSAELTFDLGLGDIFSIRLAGNCVNQDVLGSLEYACEVVGSKLILVLGHTRCGAVTGACNGVELGNVTALLSHIQPAVATTKRECSDLAPSDPEFVGRATVNNVSCAIQEIRGQSEILQKLEADGAIEIAGGVYDVETGGVEFLP
ncbi:MAG: carbonic anhydrase family protein [Candidatus Binatia bacterium]|nr:carbonic anhydrase family protein [Candidatus Binatia bacterium]